MASVSELVEDMAKVMAEPVETVNAYARALIDSGDLPKSRGRAIAQVEIEHIVKLMLAVAIGPKIKDTASEVAKYFHMKKPGIMPDHPASLQGEAGDDLCDLVEAALSRGEERREFRKECLDARIALTLNWPEIEVHIRNGVLRFKSGGRVDRWDGFVKRQVSVSGRAFAYMGAGSERDYHLLATIKKDDD